jgi:hypothetical protein
MSDLKFTEGHKYKVQRLHYIDSENTVTDVQNAEVVFTAGWVCVTEESSEPYVLPRERVVQAEGLCRPTSTGTVSSPSSIR